MHRLDSHVYISGRTGAGPLLQQQHHCWLPWVLDHSQYLPSLYTIHHVRRHNGSLQLLRTKIAAAAAAVGPAEDMQQSQASKQPRGHRHGRHGQQQQHNVIEQPYTGRLLIKQQQHTDSVPTSLSELRGSLHRGVTGPDLLAGQQAQQQQQQQPGSKPGLQQRHHQWLQPQQQYQQQPQLELQQQHVPPQLLQQLQQQQPQQQPNSVCLTQQNLPLQQHQQQPPLLQQQWQQQLQRHHMQQQLQQQRAEKLQSLRDKNMSFSGALRGLASVKGLLQLMQHSKWGLGLCDLDGVSVAGALVWLVKSKQWQDLQSGQTRDWRLRQQGLNTIKVLLDRAQALVLSPQHLSAAVAAAGWATGSPVATGSADTETAAAGCNDTQAVLIRPAELVSVIYCTSKLGQHRPELLAAAAAALKQDLYACSPTELFRLIWGLATARVHPGDEWLLNFCKAAQAKFFMSSAPQLALTVYSLARLGYRPPDVWIAAWLETSLPLLEGFSAQNLANAAWGLSCWRFQAPADWLSAFYSATSAVMHELTPIGISQLQLGLVTLSAGTSPPSAWLQQVVTVAESQFQEMELLQLCNFGWALAQWRYAPPAETFTAYLRATEGLLLAATPTDLATLIWICNKLSYVPQQSWLEAWFATTAAALPRCEPQHLTTIALVLGAWGLVPVPGFSVEYWRATKARFQDFSAYQMAQLVWGLGRARRTVPNTWAITLLATFTQLLLPEATTEDACRLIRGLSYAIVKPKGSKAWVAESPVVQQQLLELCDWLQPQLQQLAPQNFQLLVQGLSALRLRVGEDFQVALQQAAAQLDEQLTPMQRQLLAANLQRMKHRIRQRSARQVSRNSSSNSGSRGDGDL